MKPVPFDRIVVPALHYTARARLKALGEGQVLRLHVKHAENGVVKLAGDGITVTAGVTTKLTRGDTLTVRVRFTGGTTYLELLQRTSFRSLNRPMHRSGDDTLFSRFVAVNGLSDDSASGNVFRAFLSSLRGLSPDLFRRSAAQLRGVPKGNRRTARAVVELTDRDISLELLEPKHATALMAWFTGDFGGGSADARKNDDLSEDEQPSNARALKKFLHRVTASADHPLQLYNALSPNTTDDHWVVFPIRAIAGAQSLSSVLKVCWDIRKSRPREVILSVEHGAGRWWFRWDVDRVTRLIGAGSEGGCAPPPDTLLAILGGTRHTENRVESDGFSLHGPDVHDGSIEHYG